MLQPELISRRSVLAAGAGAAAAAVALGADGPAPTKSRIKQSVCRWCYGSIPLEKLAAAVKKMGYLSIELLNPKEYLTIKPFGLTCAMLQGTGPIHDCLNRTENHDRCERDLRRAIEFAAAEGLPSVICLSGNRKGMADDVGLKNCAVGLKRVVGFAEEKKVTICMELLNSKVDHKDYMCDHTAWGVELVKAVGSPRFKLLYDIYHMQIMEGDVIRTIRDNKDHIAHFHTGGVPGRREIDETQELQYPAIMKAIAETGYQGYVGQEFLPARDPFASLAQAFRICAV
jgi:hydroxypyruvate isomerase